MAQADAPPSRLIEAPALHGSADRVAAFAVLATCRCLFSSKALLDFVIRCAAFGLFATSLNLLVGYTGMVSFGHGMFFGLGAYGFGLIMQTHRHLDPGRLPRHLCSRPSCAVIGAICVRLKEIYFAFVTLAFQMLIYSMIIVLGVAHRRRPGPARRHPAARVLRHRAEPDQLISTSFSVRAAGVGLLMLRQIAQSRSATPCA